MTHPDTALDALQEKWAGKWKIWRSRRGFRPDVRDGDFYASLMDHNAGVYPTVARKTPAELDEALHDQEERASGGGQRVTPSDLWELK